MNDILEKIRHLETSSKTKISSSLANYLYITILECDHIYNQGPCYILLDCDGEAKKSPTCDGLPLFPKFDFVFNNVTRLSWIRISLWQKRRWLGLNKLKRDEKLIGENSFSLSRFHNNEEDPIWIDLLGKNEILPRFKMKLRVNDEFFHQSSASTLKQNQFPKIPVSPMNINKLSSMKSKSEGNLPRVAPSLFEKSSTESHRMRKFRNKNSIFSKSASSTNNESKRIEPSALSLSEGYDVAHNFDPFRMEPFQLKSDTNDDNTRSQSTITPTSNPDSIINDEIFSLIQSNTFSKSVSEPSLLSPDTNIDESHASTLYHQDNDNYKSIQSTHQDISQSDIIDSLFDINLESKQNLELHHTINFPYLDLTKSVENINPNLSPFDPFPGLSNENPIDPISSIQEQLDPFSPLHHSLNESPQKNPDNIFEYNNNYSQNTLLGTQIINNSTNISFFNTQDFPLKKSFENHMTGLDGLDLISAMSTEPYDKKEDPFKILLDEFYLAEKSTKESEIVSNI